MADSTVIQFDRAARERNAALRPDPVESALARAIEHLPQPPPGLDACIAYLTESPQGLARSPIGIRALQRLRANVFDAPGRAPEMRSLWRESVATASAAGLLSRELGLEAKQVTAAGLLHRLGDVWTLAVLAQVEASTGMRLVGAAMNQGHLLGNGGLASRIASGWSIGADVLRAALGWRECLDEADDTSGPLTPARAVYLAHLFAVERLYGDYSMPGIIEIAAGELGVSLDAIGAVRRETAGIDVLLKTLG